MINDAVSVFLDEIPICGSLMGLDFGTKTIGIAVSDTEQTIATGIKTIRRTKFQKDLLSLKLIIEHRQIKGLVLGLPKNMNGTEGPRCQSTRAFANNISNSIMSSSVAVPSFTLASMSYILGIKLSSCLATSISL